MKDEVKYVYLYRLTKTNDPLVFVNLLYLYIETCQKIGIIEADTQRFPQFGAICKGQFGV